MIFNRADAGHQEMLLRRGGAAEPAVIRNIYQKIGAIGGKVANFIRENGFITNKYAERIPARKRREAASLAFAEAADFIGDMIDDCRGSTGKARIRQKEQDEFCRRKKCARLWS